MTLTEIHEQRADTTSKLGYNVSVSNLYGWVNIYAIDNDSTKHIFMQGDDAIFFISERDKLYNKLGDISKHTLELSLALDYIENILL